MISWNWSWDLYEPDPQPEIIAGLAKDIVIMSGFERGGFKDILGKKVRIDEYSLGYTGPSEKFRGVCKEAKKNGHKVMAKLQIGTTHELATVPNLPLIGNLYGKFKSLSQLGIGWVMGSWNFGNMLTLNTYAVGKAMDMKKLPAKNDFLERVSAEYFPGLGRADIDKLKKAWGIFAAAMDSYPFSISFLYAGITNYALSYWIPPAKIKGKTTGRSWLMDKRGDNLSESLGKFSLEEVSAGLKELSQKWQKGLKLYQVVFKGKKDKHSRDEYASAFIAGSSFLSTRHVYQVYTLCSDWQEQKREEYLKLCRHTKRRY